MRRGLVLLMLHWLTLCASASVCVTDLFNFDSNQPTGSWLETSLRPKAESDVIGSANASPVVSIHGFSQNYLPTTSLSDVKGFQPQLPTLPISSNSVDVSINFDAPFFVPHPLGQPFTYHLGLTNAGPAVATGVVLTNQLSGLLADPIVAASQGTFSITNGLLRWQAGNLAPGSTADISIEATPIAEGSAEISASVNETEFDYNFNNNSGSVSVPVGVADLTLTILRPPDDELEAGVPFQLSVVVTNLGPDDSAATLYCDGHSDFIPAGYVLSQGQVVQFQDGGIPGQIFFGNLPALGTARLTLTLIPKQSSNLLFGASVAGSVTEPETNAPNNAFANLLVGPGQGIIEFTIAQTNVPENSGQVLCQVSRHDGSSGTVQISYSSHDGTAIAGQDYVTTAGTLTFLQGEISKVIAVPIINNTQPDCNRQFSLTLTNPVGGAFLFGMTNLAIAIDDDDLVPVGGLKAASIGTNGLNTGTGTGSAFPSISADGRWLVFMSTDGDLVSNDTNGVADIFLKDLQTGQTKLVSVNSNGDRSGNAASALPAISADGHRVIFATMATDIVTNPVPSGSVQTVVRDLVSGITQLVSVNPDGSGSDGQSAPAQGVNNYNGNPVGGISSNGQFVLFYHAGHDLVPGNTSNHIAYFVRDLAAQTTRLVTVNSAGTGPSSGDQFPDAALSADGRRVVITSNARDLVNGFGNGSYQVFVRDLASATTIPASVRFIDGGPSLGAGQAVISADGRYVTFSASGNDLVNGDDNPNDDVFVRDIDAGTTYRASAGLYKPCNTPSLSADGRFVAFRSGSGTGPVPQNDSQVFLRDCWSNTLALVSVDCLGDGPCNQHARNPVINADGRYVFFQSFATDLAPGTFDNSIVSLYRRDLREGKTVLVSMNRALTGGPANPFGSPGSVTFGYPALSADGTAAAFASSAEDLVWGDGNGAPDVFVWRAGDAFLSGPRLKIDGGEFAVLIQWPRDATNFMLQSTPNLSVPAWTDLLSTTSNQFLQIQPADRAFFRLRK